VCVCARVCLCVYMCVCSFLRTHLYLLEKTFVPSREHICTRWRTHLYQIENTFVRASEHVWTCVLCLSTRFSFKKEIKNNQNTNKTHTEASGENVQHKERLNELLRKLREMEEREVCVGMCVHVSVCVFCVKKGSPAT
jgi:hypothetical protein